MARPITDEEMKWIEERRRQGEIQAQRVAGTTDEERQALEQRRAELQAAGQQKRVAAMHDVAADWRKNADRREIARFNEAADEARYRAWEEKKARILKNPSAEPDTKLRNMVLRQAELDAANDRQRKILGTEDVTRIKEAQERRLGMENQGVGAATIRANAEKEMQGLSLADKEKQRQHELALLKQNQDFTGAQSTAERQNKLEIAKTQGQSAVDAARAQAEARAADISAKNDIEREKIAARKEIAAMRENGKLTQAGTARLSKIYNGLVAAGYGPARIRALLMDEGWSAEDIAAAQGRGQGLGQ